MRGLRTAPTIRRVIAAGVHLQLGVHQATTHVEPAEHLVGLVERAVVEDVDLDALEQREAGAGEVLVDRVDHAELRGSAAPALSPLATVSRGEWSVSTR